MTRILLVETAPPKRVRMKAEEILAAGMYTQPELTILCRPDAQTVQYLSEIEGARIVPYERIARRDILRRLKRSEFEVIWMFWTGEKTYWGMKWCALKIPALFRQVDIGDGRSFKLGKGNFFNFLRIRLRHSRPSDYDLFEPTPAGSINVEPPPEHYTGEKILILQSAQPACVLRALEKLKEHPLFTNPRYTLFCRNRLAIVRAFHEHPMLYRIIAHSETNGAWRHLRALRRAHFDAAVVFFTGDPSYWKLKYFAFLLGARHKVIFNESNDCFYFSVKTWMGLMSYRREQTLRLHRLRNSGDQSSWGFPARAAAIALTKLLLLPFRFVWLILTWLRLRTAARRHSS